MDAQRSTKRIGIGTSTCPSANTRLSLRDFSIDTYIRRIETSQVFSGLPAVSEAIHSQRDAEAAPDGLAALEMGWALKVRKPTKRFTVRQRAFLTEKFEEGARTGRKYDPHNVAKQMRRHPDFPSKDDWLTWTQISSFWSRLSLNRERSSAGLAPAPVDDEFDIEEAADDAYANAFEEHITESIQSVIDEVMGRE